MIIDKDAETGQLIWSPDQTTIAQSRINAFTQFVQQHDVSAESYQELWEWSVAQPEHFWELFVQYAGVQFGTRPQQIRSDEPMPDTRWFPGSTLNYARHLLEGHEGTALIAIAENGSREEYSWDRLRDEVAALAAYFRSIGVVPGDRVVAILPNVPEAAIGLLAAVSVGAIWSICAPEFGAGALTTRFVQLEPKVVLAAPGYTLAGQSRDRRHELATVLRELPTVEHVVWVDRHSDIPAVEDVQPAHAVSWESATATTTALEFTDVEFDHPLWVLFSSGTTGKPKGIVHGHGGALLEQLKMMDLQSDMRRGDRYLNVASTSWVVWNGLISALGVGATAILLDGNPTYPSLRRVWEIADTEQATSLGLGAGFLHNSAKAGIVPSTDYALSALRSILVTGSPLSPDAYGWVYQNVGDIWLCSMSGGTDIASIFVGGAPTLDVHVGRIQAPTLGVNVQAWDTDGNPTQGIGELVVVDSMPSMPLYLWGDDGTRLHDSYFATYPGIWRHGDFIEFTSTGIIIHGRSDSTLNRNGLRLGPVDIYTIVEALPEVAESMVVGVESGTEYYMPLFIELAAGADPEQTKSRIVAAIRQHLSPRYLPDEIIVMPGIPHTRTGKKLEVPIKRLLQGETLETVVDIGSVDQPELLSHYVDFAQRRVAVQ